MVGAQAWILALTLAHGVSRGKAQGGHGHMLTIQSIGAGNKQVADAAAARKDPVVTQTAGGVSRPTLGARQKASQGSGLPRLTQRVRLEPASIGASATAVPMRGLTFELSGRRR